MIFSSTSMLDLFLLLNIISTALASPVAQYYPAQSFDLAALPSDGSLNLAPSPAATDPSLMGSDPMQIAEVGVAEPQVRPGTEKKEQPQKPGQPNPQQPQDKVTCPNGKIPSCCIGTAGQDSQGSFLSGCAECKFSIAIVLAADQVVIGERVHFNWMQENGYITDLHPQITQLRNGVLIATIKSAVIS